MKRITNIAVFSVGLALLASLADVEPGLKALTGWMPSVHASNDNEIAFDVACDCRTGVGGPNRGDVFIIQGKMFPAGTLPIGVAMNDPTQRVNGVASIGNWICRGQNSFPIPPIIASAYASTPAFFNTQYFILNDGRAFTVEGYLVSEAVGEVLAVTGGIGRYSGAQGFVQESNLGTNSTTCPNFRARFKLQSGSIRD